MGINILTVPANLSSSFDGSQHARAVSFKLHPDTPITVPFALECPVPYSISSHNVEFEMAVR